MLTPSFSLRHSPPPPPELPSSAKSQVRPWPVAKAWEDLVMEEFFEQGDYEKQLGMTPDGLFDREKCKVPGSQCWFYDNMGKPLFEALATHIPETQTLLDVMRGNKDNWKAMC